MRTLQVIGFIAEEPDRVGQGFTLGSTALVDARGWQPLASSAREPLHQRLPLKLPAGRRRRPGEQGSLRAVQGCRLPGAGSVERAPLGTRRFIERLGQFLTLVGSPLSLSPIGVGNGVTSYLDSKRGTIATLKLLGATSTTIFVSYLLQIGLVLRRSHLVRTLVGALVPWLVTWLPAARCRCRPGSGSIRSRSWPAPLMGC
jgi:putative ABC transport system permease protein